jgi:murein DD-endopeptidase MepM/ murein hydrolase activator NlpD
VTAMGPIRLELPFRGRWLARNSPSRRVPSHGTDLFGVTYAIDFVAVDDRGRSAPTSWRSVLATEPNDLFIGFGQPILAPCGGTVVVAHDGEADHVARRSQFALVPYMLGQPGRVREGIEAIAGNHVIIALDGGGPYVGLVHLRRGSVRVRVGDTLRVGDPIGACGNSGNSTQPHVHVQVTDSLRWDAARGLPMVFRSYRSVTTGASVRDGMPRESEIVEH